MHVLNTQEFLYEMGGILTPNPQIDTFVCMVYINHVYITPQKGPSRTLEHIERRSFEEVPPRLYFIKY